MIDEAALAAMQQQLAQQAAFAQIPNEVKRVCYLSYHEGFDDVITSQKVYSPLPPIHP